jgi:ATP adenylyltransferase
MDRIWAPWRMEYISSTKSAGEKKCFLCVDSDKDNESLVVGRKGTAFVIMNRFPYTNGHVMVVPVRHTGLVEELSDEESLDMMRLVRTMIPIFKEEFKVDGVNVGINVGRAAGAYPCPYGAEMVRRYQFYACLGGNADYIGTSERIVRKIKEKIY